MQDIFSALGVSLKDMIFVIINFLILIFVLGKFLYKPFIAMLEKRKNTIKEAFETADAKNAEAEQKLADYEKIIANVEAKGKEIVKEARKQADARANKIVEGAYIEADRILEAARQDIERERIKAIVEMKDEIGRLAVMASEKIMQKDIEITGHDKIVEQVIEEGAERWQS